MTRPATTVHRARTEPTERSMPPSRMTKVMPTAITVLMLIWVKMLVRLAMLAKRGAKIEKKTQQQHQRQADAGFAQHEVGDVLCPHGYASCGVPWSRSVRECAVWIDVVLVGQGEDALLAEVGALDLAGDLPVGEDHDAVADAEQLGQVGGDDDDALALRRQLPEQRVDFVLGADVDAARRLVEDQHLGLAEEPLGEDDLLLVAAGEIAHPLVDGRAS